MQIAISKTFSEMEKIFFKNDTREKFYELAINVEEFYRYRADLKFMETSI